MKYVLRAWGQLQRGSQVLALGEMRLEGMGAVTKGGLRCWHWVKYVFRAWSELKRGFEVLALGEMWFHGMRAVQKGVSGVGTGLNVF